LGSCIIPAKVLADYNPERYQSIGDRQEDLAVRKHLREGIRTHPQEIADICAEHVIIKSPPGNEGVDLTKTSAG
jgi:hypothetical protein